ncbi:amidohydrolase [Oceanobacillus sp. CFH 90083]|uniref:amidohydrolase n=1 Tax=Oceanobacillus sp. CFH 90083 TaxID=2592336 RepID=UPI00128E65AF|nr:amidohydrolase [Oceanobacillus sp. CFH 90083]
MSNTIIKNGNILAINDGVINFTTGNIIIENGNITYIGSKTPSSFDTFDTVIKGENSVYIPGLVNTHTHATMALMRGHGDDLKLQDWLEKKMWPMERKLIEEDIKNGTLLSILEMVKTGTTTFLDMFDKMDIVAEAIESSGMRACLVDGLISTGSTTRDNENLLKAKEFSKNWHKKAEGRITVMMGPHSTYTCEPQYIEKIIDVAKELKLPLHTHLSENKYEFDLIKSLYGKSPVEHLNSLGFFSNPCLVAHCVHLTKSDINLLYENNVNVSHNPSSNLKLGSGIAPIPTLLEKGINVSIGTDSAASNNTLDMLSELRLAALIHKGLSNDPTVLSAGEMIQIGTIKGAKSLFLDNIGQLSIGMEADIISIDLEKSNMYPKSCLLSHIIYSLPSNNIKDVWIKGERVVSNGICTTLDEEKILFNAEKSYKRLTQ